MIFDCTGTYTYSFLPSFPACGAKTPLSKATTLCVVLIALSTLTQTFNYIPQVGRKNDFPSLMSSSFSSIDG